MKKLLLVLLVFICISCYEDYVNDYDFSGIYFTNQIDVRSFIVGERNKFDFGAVLGGVMSNNSKREVGFEIAPELLTGEILDLMKASRYTYLKDAVDGVEKLNLIPEDWYELSSAGKIVIEKGKYAGIVSVTVKDGFFQDKDETLKANYALPLKITSAEADSIIENKDYTVIGMKYECKLFGYYYHYGEWITYNSAGEETNRESLVFELPMPDNSINELKTSAPYMVTTSKAANVTDCRMNITLKSDNTVSLSLPEGSPYRIEMVGECKYNNPKLLQDRKLELNYKLIKSDGSYVIANETLAFRNRIRDGVNEWRDEDPENYK